MLSSTALRKTGSGWEFASEEALEDFVEVHLLAFARFDGHQAAIHCQRAKMRYYSGGRE